MPLNSNEKFDWHRYFKHAASYQNEIDAAKLRTGIGRFYYSAFLESRDHIIENKIFLNNFSKRIMKSKSGRIHKETRHTFDRHHSLNHNNVGKKIAQRLNILRKYRNMVDYDSQNPKNLKNIYNKCHKSSKRIFELLNEL